MNARKENCHGGKKNEVNLCGDANETKDILRIDNASLGFFHRLIVRRGGS